MQWEIDRESKDDKHLIKFDLDENAIKLLGELNKRLDSLEGKISDEKKTNNKTNILNFDDKIL